MSLSMSLRIMCILPRLISPAAVTAVRLTVLEVYEGEKYEDLAISGLFVNPDVLKTRNSELVYEYRDEAERAYQKQNQQKR